MPTFEAYTFLFAAFFLAAAGTALFVQSLSPNISKMARARAILIGGSAIALSLIFVVSSRYFSDLQDRPPTPTGGIENDSHWEDAISRAGLPQLPTQGFPTPSYYRENAVSDLSGLCSPARDCKTFLQLGAAIDKIFLEYAGYPKIEHFYGTLGTFDTYPTMIFVAPPERIFTDGRPAEIGRFNVGFPYSMRARNFSEFIRAMFDGYNGFAKVVIVVVFTDRIATFGDENLSLEDLRSLAESGDVSLVDILSTVPVKMNVRIGTLTYVFNAPRGSDPVLVKYIPSDNIDNGAVSKILNALESKG